MEELELTLSFDFSNKNHFQLVYTSQLYETFFGIFARFQTSKSTKNHETSLEGVELFLINYKGIINLGIIGISNPIKNDNDGSINFHLKIKAFEADSIIKKFVFDKTETITNNSKLIFNRTLEQFANDDLGVSNFAFDTEFYDRDGLTLLKKEYRYDDIPSDDFQTIPNTNHRIRVSTGKPPAIKAPTIRFLSPIATDNNKTTVDGRCPRSRINAIVR